MADTANVPNVEDKQFISLTLRQEAQQRKAAIADPFLPAYVSPTVDTTQTETHGLRNDPPLLPIPILASDGDVKAKFRNLREHLKTMPFFIIDPKGYIPNSEIRKWLDICLKKYDSLLSERTVTISPNTAALEQLARRYHPEEGSEEPFEISAKLSKYISQRKKGFALRNAKQDLMKAIIPTTTGKSDVADVDKAAAADECAEVFEDEADRVVKDEDAIRLRKFAREVTKKAVMEKMREKVRNKMSTITQIRGTLRESGPSGSEGEDDLDSDLQILEPVTLLTREEMESLLQPMRKKLGDDHETCLLITNALNHDEDGVRKFCKFVSDGRLRESFLATIVSVEWVFYFLAAVNGSARTLMGLLDTLADKSEANRTNAQAVVKLLTGQLGEGPYLKPFYNAFMQCRAAVVSFCVKRGGNQAEIEAVFRECLCDMDDEYERMGEMLGLTDEEVRKLTFLTTSCQMDALTQYCSSLPERDRGGEASFAVGEDRRIANMDVDDDDFSGPEGTNEVEVRVYNRMGSTSPGQSGVFTDGAGLELPDFIDEQSEDQVETISETRTDHSPMTDFHMEAPPMMLDDEPTNTRTRSPILKGKTPMRFQKGAKGKKQGGGAAAFVSSDTGTEVGRASTINDIKVETRADSEVPETIQLEVQPEVKVDDLLVPEEDEKLVSSGPGPGGKSSPSGTGRADGARRGHGAAADADREPHKHHKKRRDDSDEQGAATERGAEDVESSGHRKHKHMSEEEAAKHDESSLEELLKVAASENSPEVVSKAMEKLLNIVGKGRVSTESVMQVVEKLRGIYNKRTSDFQAMEPDHTERESVQKVLEILKTTLAELGLPAEVEEGEQEEITEDALGKSPEELAAMTPEEVEALKNKVKAERMRAKVEAAMAARVKAAAARRQKAVSSSSSSSYSSTSRSAASRDSGGVKFEVSGGRLHRRRRHRSSESSSSTSSEAYLDKVNERLAAGAHSRRLAREAREKDGYEQYSGSDDEDDESSEEDERQGRSHRRRRRRNEEDYEDDEDEEQRPGRHRRHRHHHHRRQYDEDYEGGEEEEGSDGRRKRHHRRRRRWSDEDEYDEGEYEEAIDSRLKRHHRRGERRGWSDEDEYDDEEDGGVGGRHRRGRGKRGARSDDEDSTEERKRRKHRRASDDDGGYYYELTAGGKKGKRRRQAGLEYDRYEHAVLERQVGFRRGRRSSQYFHDYDDEGGVLGYRHRLHHRPHSAGGYYPSGYGLKKAAAAAAAASALENQPQALPAVQVRLWQPQAPVRTVSRAQTRGMDYAEKIYVSAESEEERSARAPTKPRAQPEPLVRRGVSAEASMKKQKSTEQKSPQEDTLREPVRADEQEEEPEEPEEAAVIEKVASRTYSDVQEVSIGKIAFSKSHAQKLIPANKLVHAIKRKAKEVAFISPEMLERRQKTRKLLEKMQHQLGMASGEEGTAMHPLTSDQIKEAMQNPEFAEIAKEFQQLQGTQILGQDPQSSTVLENIKQQLDIVMSKTGEKPNYDKMVNLYSLLREADRKSTLDDLEGSEVRSEDLQLTAQETEYLRSLQQVVSERLLTEISVLTSLSPPERCAWMSLQENWENQRESLCVLAQLIQVESVETDLASVIVSALLMNVADGVAALESTTMIPPEERVIYYGYIRDSIEALSWFDIDVNDAKQMIARHAKYEEQVGSLFPRDVVRRTPRPSMSRHRLTLTIAPGYRDTIQPESRQGFLNVIVEDNLKRVSVSEYIKRMSQQSTQFGTSEEVPRKSSVEETAQQITRMRTAFSQATNLSEALESAGVGKQVAEEYMVIAKRVAPTKPLKQIEAIYDTAVRLPMTHHQSSLASVLSKQSDSDHEDVDWLREEITASLPPSPKPSTSRPLARAPLRPASVSSITDELIVPQEVIPPQPKPIFRAHHIAERDWQKMLSITNRIRQKKLSQRAAGLEPEPDPFLVQARPVKRQPARFSKSSDSDPKSVGQMSVEMTETAEEKSSRTSRRGRSSVNLSLVLKGAAAKKLSSKMEPFLPPEGEPRSSRYRESSRSVSSIFESLDRATLSVRGAPAPVLVPYASIEGRGMSSLRVASHAYPLNPDEIRLIEGAVHAGRQDNEVDSVYGRIRSRRAPSQRSQTRPSTVRQRESTSLKGEEPWELEVRTSRAEIGFLTRNPDLVLQQLRSRLDPGTLSCMIEDIRNYPSVGRSRTVLAQAMTKAIDLQKNEVHAKAKSAPVKKRRTVSRPSSVKPEDWRRMAPNTQARPRSPLLYHGRKLHCQQNLLAERGYHKFGNNIGEYLTRLDIIEHIQSSNQKKAHERIKNSIVECIGRITQ